MSRDTWLIIFILMLALWGMSESHAAGVAPGVNNPMAHYDPAGAALRRIVEQQRRYTQPQRYVAPTPQPYSPWFPLESQQVIINDTRTGGGTYIIRRDGGGGFVVYGD